MKKFIKTAIIVFVLTALCFSLSGCHALNEARNAQAFLNDDGTISYDGKIYKELPESSEYTDLIYSLISSSSGHDTVYITEKDVPVLLSGLVGISAYTDKDKKIICADYIMDNIMDNISGSRNYCREDIYDNFVEAIKNPNYTKYSMQLNTSFLALIYEDIDIPESIDLKDYEIAAINEIIALGDTVKDPYSINTYEETYADIYRSTEDGLISENYCTISRNDDSCYITVYEPEPDAVDEDGFYNQSMTVYKVPTSGEAAAKVKDLLDKKQQVDEKIAELLGSSDFLDDLYDPNSFGFSE